MQVFITCSETVLKWIDGVSVEILKIKTNFVYIIYRKKRAMQSDKQVKLHNKSKKCIERKKKETLTCMCTQPSLKRA